MAKMTKRVAILIGQLSYFGGVGIAAVNQVRELGKMGYDAELVVLFRKKEFDSIKIYSAYDIPVVFLSDYLPKFLRINFKFPIFSFFSFFHISAIFWAPFVMKKLHYDVILVHETYNSFSAVACAKYTHSKLITLIWDPVSYIIPRVYGKKIPKLIMPLVLKFLKMVDAFILKNSDFVLLCSGLHKKVLQSINPLVGMKVVFPGTDLINKLPKKRGKIIVSLTKWDQGKNPGFLLEIAQKIKGDFLMKIAGNWADDNLKEEFLQKIDSLKLGGKVLVLGRVTEKQKFDLFSKARVLVHPIIEAFGMFALEAAGGGCPVIIPKTSGVTELFTEGKHGFFPEEGDLEGFLTKIQLLLDDEKFALKMSENAYKIAQDNTWKNYTLRIKKIIEKVLNE